MNVAELMSALVGAGAADGMNIDEHCYFYNLVTGTPCPPPEDFGAGDRGQRYSLGAFAALAAAGFESAGNQPGQTTPPGNTIPILTPGIVGNAGNGGGLFGSMGLIQILLIGAIIYFLFFED